MYAVVLGKRKQGKNPCLSQGFCDSNILLVESLVLQRSHDTVQNKDILQPLNSSLKIKFPDLAEFLLEQRMLLS